MTLSLRAARPCLQANHYAAPLGAFTRLLAIFSLVLRFGVVGASASEAISTVEQVRQLSADQARQSLPVRLRGVVLHYNEKVFGELMIHDGKAAIYVMGTEDKAYQLRSGDLVQLDGVTSPGDYAPVVIASEIKVIGQAMVPAASERSFDQLATGVEDGQWVKVSGVVRSAVIEPHRTYMRLSMELATPGGRLTVRVPNVESLDVAALIDADATLTGTCFTVFNRNRQLIAVRLFVPSLSHVMFKTPPQRATFDSPHRTIVSLMRFEPSLAHGHRVKVRGAVTLQQPGGSLFIRDETQGLWVKSSKSPELRPGDEVDVLGFPVRGEFKPALEDAVVMKTGETVPSQPTPMTAAQARGGDFDAELVQVEARVIDMATTGGESTFVLQSDNTIFRAHLPLVSKAERPFVETDSRVKLTGICFVQAGGERASESFRLLLRSPADVFVVAAPPWWTVRRVALVLGVTALVLVGAVVWVITLRHRVRAQTAEIQRKAEREAVLEERTRIAREFHDTLGQHLSGVLLQLQAARARVLSSPESAQQVLQLAESMLRHTQSEARGAVWELRAQALENNTLASALRTVADYARNGGSVPITVQVEGEPRSTSRTIESHLLRIGQEATNNALRHGEPKNIHLRLSYGTDTVQLSIEDDGKGFEFTPAVSGQAGHFGLLGMRERAEKIGGDLRVITAPGRGTRIEVMLRLRESDAAEPLPA